MLAARDVVGLLGLRGGEDGVARALQQGLDQQADVLVVLDQEDLARGSGHARIIYRSRPSSVRSSRLRIRRAFGPTCARDGRRSSSHSPWARTSRGRSRSSRPPKGLAAAVRGQLGEGRAQEGAGGDLLLGILPHRHHPDLEPQVGPRAEVGGPFLEPGRAVVVAVDIEVGAEPARNRGAVRKVGGFADRPVEGEAQDEGVLVESRVDLGHPGGEARAPSPAGVPAPASVTITAGRAPQ